MRKSTDKQEKKRKKKERSSGSIHLSYYREKT